MKAVVAALVIALPALASAADAVSFERDIVPVLRDNCATCHLTGQEPGGMKLHPGGAYASLVNVPSVESRLARVKPGKPEESYLMHKLDGTHLDVEGQGERMPFGFPPLSDEVRARVRAWIAAGAPKN